MSVFLCPRAGAIRSKRSSLVVLCSSVSMGDARRDAGRSWTAGQDVAAVGSWRTRPPHVPSHQGVNRRQSGFWPVWKTCPWCPPCPPVEEDETANPRPSCHLIGCHGVHVQRGGACGSGDAASKIPVPGWSGTEFKLVRRAQSCWNWFEMASCPSHLFLLVLLLLTSSSPPPPPPHLLLTTSSSSSPAPPYHLHLLLLTTSSSTSFSSPPPLPHLLHLLLTSSSAPPPPPHLLLHLLLSSSPPPPNQPRTSADVSADTATVIPNVAIATTWSAD